MQIRIWVGTVFLGVSPVFFCNKYHSTISPHSSHSFRFISSPPVMVRQAWSAGILAIHRPSIQGLHCISSLDPTLGQTRVQGELRNLGSAILDKCVLIGTRSLITIPLPKYYARPQTAVARGLGQSGGRLAGHHTDAAPKHSLLFQFSFRIIIGHAHRRKFAKRRRQRLLIVIIVRRQCCKCSDCDYCDL